MATRKCWSLMLVVIFCSCVSLLGTINGEQQGHCDADRTQCSQAGAAGGRDSGLTRYETFEDVPEETVRRGHLKELGSHRDPDGEVEVLPYMISSEDFYERYVTRHKPVVIRNVAKHWPASKKWTDDYLKETYGNLSLNMETRDDDKWNIPPSRTVGSFVDVYQKANLYLVDELPPGMRKDVVMPLCLRCEEIADRFFVSYFWMSNGGTSSKLHIDTDENLLTVINGHKRIVLISPRYSRDVYADEARMFGVSEVNVSAVDLQKFPRFANVRFLTTSLGPGDALYLPQMWWHYVFSAKTRQQAVAMWWKSIPYQKGFAKKSVSTSRRRSEEERKADNRTTSLARWLEEYIFWIDDIAKDADTRPVCANQVKLMYDYPFETDKEPWREELTQGRRQTDNPSEDLDDSMAIPAKAPKYKKAVEEPDIVSYSPPTETKFCYFDVNNPESPCNHPFCNGGEDPEVQPETEGEGEEVEKEDEVSEGRCLRHMLDYCDKFEDRGCVIELPQVLNKRTASEIEQLEAMRGVGVFKDEL